MLIYSPKYPNLRVMKPLVEFKDGMADVSEEDAALLMSRKALGITPGPPAAHTPADLPEEESDVTEKGDEADSEVRLPAKNATVKDWVEFMEVHGIEHDDGATKAEMKAAAEKHFAKSD